MEAVTDRFLRYVAVDTQSCEESKSQPSTPGQWTLLGMLRDELEAMGIEATLDKYGYVMGRIPANTERKVPKIGFLAHVDTSPDASGKSVKPQIINNYDGSDIGLKGVPGLSLRTSDFPELLNHIGETLITTDGTTLLGADDKAGVAEIMTAAEYIVTHPEFEHGEIRIGFTPDEEIGRGVVKFDVKAFDADFAYTVDGGDVGELEYENFNAAEARIRIQGRNVHPGYAKGKMKNAIRIGMELEELLPQEQRPEHTEGYEGFFHITSFEGTVEQAFMSLIIRDHDEGLFRQKIKLVEESASEINRRYGDNTVTVEITHQYSNMRKQVEPHYHIVETAVMAMEQSGIKPKIQPVRGGTDGANLSFMGLPCPNIFAGGLNFHGKMEFVTVENMQKATDVILRIIKLSAL